MILVWLFTFSWVHDSIVKKGGHTPSCSWNKHTVLWKLLHSKFQSRRGYRREAGLAWIVSQPSSISRFLRLLSTFINVQSVQRETPRGQHNSLSHYTITEIKKQNPRTVQQEQQKREERKDLPGLENKEKEMEKQGLWKWFCLQSKHKSSVMSSKNCWTC